MTKTLGWLARSPLSRGTFAPSDRAVLRTDPEPVADPTASPWFLAASSLAVAGLTLVEPRNLGPGARAAYRITTAALAGAYTAATLPTVGVPAGMPARYADGPGAVMLTDPLGAAGRGSVGLAVGGLTLGLADQLEALDGKLVDWLSDRGARRPRWWMAGVGLALTAAGWAGDRAEGRALQRALLEAAEGADSGEDLRPADPAVVGLLDALLLPGVPGAEALRIQLETLQQQELGGGFLTDALLVAGDDTPRITPRMQVWPVKGRFARDGVVFEVELQINDGRLESLSIMIADEMYAVDDVADHEGEEAIDTDAAIDALDAWPAVRELEIVTEDADPIP